MTKKSRRARGRPRIQNQEREPNGRISRAAARRAARPEADPRAVALAARARHFGLPGCLLPDPKTASFAGRLCLAGRLSEDEYFAGQRFLEIYNIYQKTILSPGAVYEPKGRFPANDNEADYADYAARAKARFEAACAALCRAEAAERGKARLPLRAAVDVCLIGGWEKPYLLPALKAACACLRAHFAAERKRK